jgi:hypothetical protein
LCFSIFVGLQGEENVLHSVRSDEKGSRTAKLQKLAALRAEEAKIDTTLRELQTNDPALISAMQEDIQEAKQVCFDVLLKCCVVFW